MAGLCQRLWKADKPVGGSTSRGGTRRSVFVWNRAADRAGWPRHTVQRRMLFTLKGAMNMTPIVMGRALLIILGGGLLGSTAQGRTDDQINLTSPATQAEIANLVDDLSHPSYEKRTFATRRLCAIGTPARDRLQTAAEGGDIETALRAKAILAVFDRLMFMGIEVKLAFTKSTVGWDESTDLLLTMVNRSTFPAHVPFEIDTARRGKLSDDARQVGDMLDLADLVHVRCAGGLELELTVDDITDDPDVVAAVQDRLNGGPSGILSPGQQATVTARAFNRGWARYRLLEEYTYTVRLDYVPAWNDGMLVAQHVGRVTSNEATITITRGAPDSISKTGLQASLALERCDKHLVVFLTNHSDRARLINKSFGASTPFAEGRWIWELDGGREEVPHGTGPAVSWHDFDPNLLVEVSAGGSLELARIDMAELRRRLEHAGADLKDARGTVHFGYANACNRQWQTRQGPALLGNPKAPHLFRSILPRQILSTRLTSPRLPGSDLK